MIAELPDHLAFTGPFLWSRRLIKRAIMFARKRILAAASSLGHCSDRQGSRGSEVMGTRQRIDVVQRRGMIAFFCAPAAAGAGTYRDTAASVSDRLVMTCRTRRPHLLLQLFIPHASSSSPARLVASARRSPQWIHFDSLRHSYVCVHADEDAEPRGRGARKEELARPTLASPAVPAATSPGTRPSVSLIGGICPYQTPLSTSTPARILLAPLRGNCRLTLPSSAPSCCVRSLHLSICSSRRLHRGLRRSGGISFPMHFNRSSFALS